MGVMEITDGIEMLQSALWREYRRTSVKHHADHRYTTHTTCKRCGASWFGDVLVHPEQHEDWCPLSWQPTTP